MVLVLVLIGLGLVVSGLGLALFGLGLGLELCGLVNITGMSDDQRHVKGRKLMTTRF